METADRGLLDQWMAHWSDLIDFEVYPVVTSKEAFEKIAPLLWKAMCRGDVLSKVL